MHTTNNIISLFSRIFCIRICIPKWKYNFEFEQCFFYTAGCLIMKLRFSSPLLFYPITPIKWCSRKIAEKILYLCKKKKWFLNKINLWVEKKTTLIFQTKNSEPSSFHTSNSFKCLPVKVFKQVFHAVEYFR